MQLLTDMQLDMIYALHVQEEHIRHLIAADVGNTTAVVVSQSSRTAHAQTAGKLKHMGHAAYMYTCVLLADTQLLHDFSQVNTYHRVGKMPFTVFSLPTFEAVMQVDTHRFFPYMGNHHRVTRPQCKPQ